MSAPPEAWFEIAERDLDVARYLLEGERFSAAAFYAQQAAEKALKALLAERPPPKTHDVFALAKMIAVPQRILDLANEFSPVYVATRYPEVGEVEIDEEEAAALVKAAEEVVAWALRQRP